MERPARGRETLFQLRGVPPLGTAVSLALQHLVVLGHLPLGLPPVEQVAGGGVQQNAQADEQQKEEEYGADARFSFHMSDLAFLKGCGGKASDREGRISQGGWFVPRD